MASWTAFVHVCVCNGGRTRLATEMRPRATEVMARSRSFFRVLEVRCLPLKYFLGISIRAIDNDKDVTNDWDLNTFKMYCSRKKSRRVPKQKIKKSFVCVMAILPTQLLCSMCVQSENHPHLSHNVIQYSRVDMYIGICSPSRCKFRRWGRESFDIHWCLVKDKRNETLKSALCHTCHLLWKWKSGQCWSRSDQCEGEAIALLGESGGMLPREILKIETVKYAFFSVFVYFSSYYSKKKKY